MTGLTTWSARFILKWLELHQGPFWGDVIQVRAAAQGPASWYTHLHGDRPFARGRPSWHTAQNQPRRLK
jgi:hypothetical protein